MKKTRIAMILCGPLTSLALSACAGVTDGTEETPAVRSTVQEIRVGDREIVRRDVRVDSYEYASERRLRLGLSQDDDFRFLSHRTGKGGFEHVRMAQTYRGVPVFGADVVVHSARGTIRSMDGNLVKGLGGMSVEAQLDADEAQAIAQADYAARAAAGAHLSYSRNKSELVIYSSRDAADKGARLTWHVEFFTGLQAGLQPGRWHYFIDARSGRIVSKQNWLHTLEQASGPGGNPNIARTWNMRLDVEPAAQANTFQMATSRMVTRNMNNSENGNGTIVTGPLSPIGDAAINDAHGFAEATLGMMQDWAGTNSIDGQGFVITSLIHYGVNFENAFWDGSQMTYGDGDQFFFALTGDLDVVAHEINHGFTEHHSNLIYDGPAGGMNESFSDVAGAAAEFYDEGDAGDFDVGKDITKPGAGFTALRFMCDPPADGASIDNAANFTPGMDVHFSSGVGNKAFCLMSKRLSSGSPTGPATQAGVQRAAAAWFEANASFWTSNTGFNQACQGTIDAAIAMGYSQAERDAIRDSWLDVGVYCDGLVPPLMCDTIHTEDTGVLTSPNYPANYFDDTDVTDCIQPASNGIVTLTFTNFRTEQDYDFVEVTDGSTGVQSSFTSGNQLPPPITAPIVVVRFTSDFSITEQGWRAEWTTAGGNADPAASYTYSATDLAVTFTDTSTDSDGTIAGWAWDFGDGSVDATQNPSHTYAAEGTYTVTLTVTDNGGATASATMDITVTAPPPPPPDAGTPDAEAPSEPDAGETPTPGGDGCGCEAGGTSSGTQWPAFVLGLGALVAIRRRRRN